jgi:hypothetical protein
MAFHYVFTDYSGVEFNLPNYQKYTVKVLGATLLLVKLSSLIKTYLRGGGQTIFRGAGRIAPLLPSLKKHALYLSLEALSFLQQHTFTTGKCSNTCYQLHTHFRSNTKCVTSANVVCKTQ